MSATIGGRGGGGAEEGSAAIVRIVTGIVKDVSTSKDRTMDFALTVDVTTQDERTLGERAVLVRTQDGRGLADMRGAYLGKYVWAPVDALDRAAGGGSQLPARGRPRWSELRNARVSPAAGGGGGGGRDPVRVCLAAPPSATAGGLASSETVYVLDEEARRAYTLRMPPRGWRCTLMTFVGSDGAERKLLFTAEVEK